MSCQRCKSKRIAEVNGKCSDMCSYEVSGTEVSGYVPSDLGVGGGDYIEVKYCLDCGQLQGKFPLPVAEIEKDITDEEVAEFYDNYFVEGQRFTFPRYLEQELSDSAERLCSKFARFVSDFLSENHQSPYKMVSINKFVQMYRSNDVYMDE